MFIREITFILVLSIASTAYVLSLSYVQKSLFLGTKKEVRIAGQFRPVLEASLGKKTHFGDQY